MIKRRKVNGTSTTMIRSRRVNQDQAKPPPLYTPSISSKTLPESKFDASPHNLASKFASNSHSTLKQGKEPVKFITPMTSQHPIRKRPMEDVPSFQIESVPTSKRSSESKAILHVDPDPKQSSIISNPQSTFPSRRRNKDKVYGKKTNTFHFDPFDFL